MSHQAYLLLRAHLRSFPYARLDYRPPSGNAARGLPFLIVDERSAWEPLAATRCVALGSRQPLGRRHVGIMCMVQGPAADPAWACPPVLFTSHAAPTAACRDRSSISWKYLFEEAIKASYAAASSCISLT